MRWVAGSPNNYNSYLLVQRKMSSRIYIYIYIYLSARCVHAKIVETVVTERWCIWHEYFLMRWDGSYQLIHMPACSRCGHLLLLLLEAGRVDVTAGSLQILLFPPCCDSGSRIQPPSMLHPPAQSRTSSTPSVLKYNRTFFFFKK